MEHPTPDLPNLPDYHVFSANEDRFNHLNPVAQPHGSGSLHYCLMIL